MSQALWNAVNAITRSTTDDTNRHPDEEWIVELKDQTTGWCDVADYRGATIKNGTIPSLWDQAEMALHKASKQVDGTRSHLSTRSPADVALMEMMLTIRELVDPEVRLRLWNWKQKRYSEPIAKIVPEQIRQLARHLTAAEVDEWTFKIAQWKRLLETYLQAVESGPRVIRLRCRCPLCLTEFVTVKDPDGNKGSDGQIQRLQARPLVTRYRDDWFRCVECEACQSMWWRGNDVHELMKLIAADEEHQKAQRALLAEQTA